MGILRDYLFTSIAAAVLMAFFLFLMVAIVSHIIMGHCYSCEGNIMTVAGCANKSPLNQWKLTCCIMFATSLNIIKL